MGLKKIEMAHGTEERLMSLFGDLMKIFYSDKKNWIIGKTNSTIFSFNKKPLALKTIISNQKN